jgi:hypothetical protein
MPILHSINNESEWNALANASQVTALTSDDIVRISTSFTFTTQPVVLMLGSGLLNGRTNTITLDSTDTISGYIHTDGGTVRHLKIAVATGTNFVSALLADDSNGTVRNCEFANIRVPDGGALIMNSKVAEPLLTISRIKASAITTLANAYGFLKTVFNVTLEKCSLTVASGSDTNNNLLGETLYGCLIQECTIVVLDNSPLHSYQLINNAIDCVVNKCMFVAPTSISHFSFLSANVACTDYLFIGGDVCFNDARETQFGRCTFTRCQFLTSVPTAFIQNIPISSTTTLTQCNAAPNTAIAAFGSERATGTLGSINAFSGPGAAASFGFGPTWTDSASGFPLLTAFTDTNEFINYASADSTTVTRAAMTFEGDAFDESVICFAAGTHVSLANGNEIEIQKLKPGMCLQGIYSNRFLTVKELLSCKTKNIVIFPAFSLSDKQKRDLITSKYHLVKSKNGKWAEAYFAPGGLRCSLSRPIRLFNVQTEEGWGIMLAEQVQCETCAVTPKDKDRRAMMLQKYNILHFH